jgi:predicted MPP superfamily phosphohydrolase
LVNSHTDEMKDYQALFSHLKAPLGVFSVLGNHDYGDYSRWNSIQDKNKDHQELIQVHKYMGYDLLMNTNRKIKIGNDEISIVGVENWSASSDFPKHGRMDLAMPGTEDSAIRLLLSHDPSHWRAQILPHYPSVDATFSGHTHGMQMGIRLPHFQWSPIQYVYPEWAGLYQSGNQKLYVNVGFGFIGFPGRIGMPPEISLFTLSSKNA